MMRRLVLIASASLLALPVAAQSANPPRASAQLDRCHPSPDAAQRYAVFSGAMRSLRAGQDRMDMRFDLFRRAPGAFAIKRVAAPGLGAWKRADAGVGHFKFRQKVENLAAPAAYRAVVSFRWINANGRVFARAQHVTAECPQPLPDLRIVGIRHLPATGAYRVTARNVGGLQSRGFDVSLSVGGRPVVPSQTVGGLGPHKSVVLTFTRPSCADPVVATADAGNAVPESDEANNTLTASCASIDASRSH
jgi:CARDB